MLFTKAYTTFAIPGVRRGLRDKGGILGIFFPCIGIIRNNKHSGYSAFGFLYSEYCLRLKPRVGRGGGPGTVFFMGFKSEEFCFKQVWMGERKGKGRGGRGPGLVFMHSVYDATYLHRPGCSILQSFFHSTLGICIWGVAATGEAFRACFGKTQLM